MPAVLSHPLQVQGATGPASVMLGPNQRVRTKIGVVGSAQDSLTFSDGGAGRWALASTRVRVSGAAAVNAVSQGQHVPPGSSPAPMAVVGGDPRVRCK